MRYQRNQTVFRYPSHEMQLTVAGEHLTLAATDALRDTFAALGAALRDLAAQPDITEDALDTVTAQFLPRLIPDEDARNRILEGAVDAGDKLELLCFFAHAYHGYGKARLRRLSRYGAKEEQ